MNIRSFAALSALVFPFLSPLAHASTYNAIQLNGSCEIGVCDYTNPVPFGNSAVESFSLTTTLGNGDVFSIAGTAAANSNSDGTTLPEGVDLQVTYLGNAMGGASLSDTIDVDIFVAFDTDLSSGLFNAGDFGYLGDGLATGSSAYYSGYGPTLQGPFTNPGVFNSDYNTTLSSSNNVIGFEIVSQANFAAGSAVDSAFVFGSETAPVTPTPEPGTIWLLGGSPILVAQLRRSRP